MKKFGLLVAMLAISTFAAGVALGQGRGGQASGGGQPGGRPGAGAPGGWHGGGGGPAHGWNGGGWRGGGQPGYWYGNRGYGGWRGWYGPGAGVYFGAPLWWGAYGYPYASPYAYPYAYPYSYAYPAPRYYAYPGYYPYPAYVERGPTIYIQKPRVVASAPPPAAPPPPAPQLERFTLSAKELFAFDRAELASPQPKLDQFAAAMRRNPQITGVRVTGYTDRLGAEAYNLALSQRRADAVKAYLVGKGVAADRLVAIGMGEANPMVQCTQTAHAALIACLEPNRRVEIEPITIERPVG